MTPRPANIHGTAIVVGNTGLLFLGPSGAGKSSLAFHCLSEARMHGQFAALVADDQVFISVFGAHVVAYRPETIRDRIELRYGGIACVDSIPRARLDYAVVPVDPATADRLPEHRRPVSLFDEISLPGIHLPLDQRLPFSFINALIAS